MYWLFFLHSAFSVWKWYPLSKTQFVTYVVFLKVWSSWTYLQLMTCHRPVCPLSWSPSNLWLRKTFGHWKRCWNSPPMKSMSLTTFTGDLWRVVLYLTPRSLGPFFYVLYYVTISSNNWTLQHVFFCCNPWYPFLRQPQLLYFSDLSLFYYILISQWTCNYEKRHTILSG